MILTLVDTTASVRAPGAAGAPVTVGGVNTVGGTGKGVSPLNVGPSGKSVASGDAAAAGKLSITVGADKSVVSGSAFLNGVSSAKSGLTFKNVVNDLLKQTEGKGAQGATGFTDKLAVRLSEVLKSLETIDPTQSSIPPIKTALQQISTALTDFQSASGSDLIGTLQSFYSPPTDQVPSETVIQAEAEALPTEVSNLIAFVNLVTRVAEVVQSTSDVPMNLQPGTPSAQTLLSDVVTEKLSANPQFVQATRPANEIRQGPKTGASPATLALTGLSASVEETAASAQAVTQGKSGLRAISTAETKPASPIDIQVAVSFVQRGAESGLSGTEQFKNTLEFVSNVANGQLTQQNPGFGLSPIVEPRFADLLPLERQLWTSPSPVDASNATQSSDAPAAKTPRFTAAIIDQIRAANVTDGQTKIELSPRGLGNIEIEVSTDVDGGTNVVIRADNNVVLTALREMREPWAQIQGMENGSSFSFEDMSSREDGASGNGAGDQADDSSGSLHDAAHSTDIASTAIIDGDQLDLMT